MMTAENPDHVPSLSSIQLKIGGMSCSFCANAIERGLRREKGVEDVHVSLAHEEALIRFRPTDTSETRIKDMLRSLGYLVRDPRKVDVFDEQLALERRERNDLMSAASGAVVMVLAMAATWLNLWPMEDWQGWAAWGIATYVFLWNGRRIVRMAWGAARRGITNQHVLLVVGAAGAYLGGLLGVRLPALGWPGFPGFPAVDFFSVVVFLTAYHLLSGYVSLIVRTKASESVRRLLEMQPPSAHVIRAGKEREVAIEEVAVGDRVRIRPGERIPVDGIVEDGTSAVDQSLVTGEPIPEEKTPGNKVIGGSVNQAGTLLVRVTRVGEDSFLRQIARHVEEAKAMKPGIVVLVDRVLRHYVPVVLATAVATFLFWSVAPLTWSGDAQWVTAIYAAVTVLVMGYPCALGMATPLALIHGGGMAAERGILMRSGDAFQILKDITHIVIDKTGTLTDGAPRLVEIEVLSNVGRSELLRLTAGAEAASEHPLARAVVDAAERARGVVPAARDFHATVGRGVEATVAGHRVLVGTPVFLRSRNIDVKPAGRILRTHGAQAHTMVFVAVDAKLAGALAIADAVKPDAAAAIATLKARGLAPIMVTGDNRRTAEVVGRQVGIENIHAEIVPQEKAMLIRSLQDSGARVAMVGDGINDAPALMQAHVGIAIGAGTDIAIESSDIVLIGKRLGAVPEAISIGGISYRKTVQNLWLAFVFNGLGMPLAATGLVHPSWAMAAMAASVTLVLANSFGGRMIRRGKGQIDSLPERPERMADEDGRVSAPDAALVLSVPSIRCEKCVKTIETNLIHEAGVARVEADAMSKEVHVAYRPLEIAAEEIERAITRLGHRVGQSTDRGVA